jgi:hypothetical protein
MTAEHFASRLKQRSTPTIEDTGLLGDQETQDDAIASYRLFASIVAGFLATLVLIQWFVPPQDVHDSDAPQKRESEKPKKA